MNILSQIRLPAKRENLDKFSEHVLQCAEKQGIDQKRLMQINLSLEEVLVNICDYSYRDNEGDIEVICGLDNDNRFVIEITDYGIPFDIRSFDEPDLNADISERKVGGLGIYLIKKMMDDIQYRFEDNKNILKLIVDINSKDS